MSELWIRAAGTVGAGPSGSPSISHPPLHVLPERSVPARIWVVVAAAVVAGGLAAVYPRAGIGAVFGMLGIFAAFRVVQRPFLAIPIALCIFPIFALLRSMYTGYHFPVFAGGLRTFPEVLILLAGFGVMLRVVLHRTVMPGVTPDDVPALLWILGGVYAFIVAYEDNVPLFGPLNGWWVSITPAVLYFVVRWGRPQACDMRLVVRVFLVTFILLAAGSFYDYVFRPNFVIGLSEAERGYFVPAGWPHDLFWRIYPRMQSLLFEENLWGTLCAFVSLGCVTHLAGLRTPILVTLLFVSSSLGMALSMSRGAWFCWAVGIGILLALRGRHRWQIIGVIAAVVVTGIVAQIALGIQGGLLGSLGVRLSTISFSAAQKGEIVSDRSFQWLIGWSIFSSQPAGTGLGTLGYAAHLSGVGRHVIADGIYFRILAEQGAPGFTLSALSLLGIGWVIFRNLDSCSPATRRWGMALFAFHCGFMVQSLAANTYDYFYIGPLYWIAFGLFVTQCDRDRLQAVVPTLKRLPARLSERAASVGEPVAQT